MWKGFWDTKILQTVHFLNSSIYTGKFPRKWNLIPVQNIHHDVSTVSTTVRVVTQQWESRWISHDSVKAKSKCQSKEQVNARNPATDGEKKE